MAGIPVADDDAESAMIRGDDKKKITWAQGIIIRDLVTETESDYYKFCKAFKCNTVDDLLATHFDRAVSALEAKKK